MHTGSVSVKRTSHGKWQARWREASGKQRAKNFDRKIDAVTHERAMRGSVFDGSYIAPDAGRLTVRQWSELWLTGARDLGAGGRDTYQADLERYILPALGDLPLRRLTPELIDQLLDELLARGLAGSTVHRQYRTIRRMCAVAVTRKRLPTNPCAEVTPPRVERQEMRFLTVAEVDALADAIGARYRAWVFVAAYGGLRWSEAIGLQRSSFDGGRLTVTHQLVRRADKEWHRDRPKTAAGIRAVGLPGFVVDELDAHLEQYVGPGDDNYLFTNQAGRPPIAQTFTWNVFKPACVRAGLGRFHEDTRRVVDAPRIHDLRHTAAALAIRIGAHPKAIQARLGHASITTTLDRYGHLFPEMDEQIAVGLDELRGDVRRTAAQKADRRSVTPPP